MSRPNYYKSLVTAKCKLEDAEKALQRSKNLLKLIEEVDLLKAKNTYLREELNKMLNDFSKQDGFLYQQLCVKIKRILYEVDAKVEKGERAHIK